MNLAAEFLRQKFQAVKATNRSISARSFALRAGISPSVLCEVFSGKRPLTKKTALKIADRLGVNIEERIKLLSYFGEVVECGGSDSPTVAPMRERPKYDVLEEDKFSFVSRWVHYAILSLMDTSNFKSQPSWIASRLGVSVEQVNDALSCLERIGIVEQTNHGYRKLRDQMTTLDIPSEAIKQFHRDSFNRGMDSLESVTTDQRDISSITVAIDAKKMGLAKQLLTEFRRNFSLLIEQGATDEVYQLQLAFFPLTKRTS